MAMPGVYTLASCLSLVCLLTLFWKEIGAMLGELSPIKRGELSLFEKQMERGREEKETEKQIEGLREKGINEIL